MRESDLQSIDREPVPLWEKVFSVAAMLIFTNVYIPFNNVQGDVVMKSLWCGIYIIILFLLLRHFRQIVSIAFHDKLLWLLWFLVALAFVSVLWSEVPAVTLLRSAALAGTTAVGVYLATRYNLPEILKLLVCTLGSSAVLSVVFILLFPEYGIHHDLYHSGAWRGIYVQKNIFGSYMVLAAVTWLLFVFSCRKGLLSMLCPFSIYVILIILSQSKTALVVFLFLLFLLLFMRIFSRRYTSTRSAVAALVLTMGGLVVLLATNLDNVLIFLERDMTLTGRTELWAHIWNLLKQRLWLGYGYGAFWLDKGSPAGYLYDVLSWNPNHAHNGYLDIWLQIGFTGVLIFGLLLLVNFFRAINSAFRKNGWSWVGMFPVMFLVYVVLGDIPGSTIMKQNHINWILFVVVSIHLSNMQAKEIQGDGTVLPGDSSNAFKTNSIL